MIRLMILSLFRWGALLFLLAVPPCLSFQNLPATRLAQIRETINATNRGSANITAAFEACDLWSNVLRDDPSVDLADEILSTCLVLYASCLVRTGQDDQAVVQYSKALKLQHKMTKDSFKEAVLGRGRALQRQLKYDEARQQFLQLDTLESAVCGAATCALREGNAKEALRVLRAFCETTVASEAAAMMGVLELSKTTPSTLQNDTQLMSKAAGSSLLYRWIMCVSRKQEQTSSIPLPERERNFSQLDLATINISPFDDHNYIHLDDKVLLHKLLSYYLDSDSKAGKFWPFGVVSESEAMVNMAKFDENVLWIHKRRSGYGSHGNQVIASQQAKQLALTLNDESVLQRMVTPPLLIDGRKFSLRIYVACFTSPGLSDTPDVYISRLGLLKLASVPVSSIDTIDMREHMTNSGRESVMTQRSLDYLEQIFATNGWSFEEFWRSIIGVVRSTLEIYQARIVGPSSKQMQLAGLGIPKILGFDFVVDSKRNAWLVEVNRFPGLEARDESDRGVKHCVLRDTWKVASTRSGLSDSEIKAVFGDLLEQNGTPSNTLCLEKIL